MVVTEDTRYLNFPVPTKFNLTDSIEDEAAMPKSIQLPIIYRQGIYRVYWPAK